MIDAAITPISYRDELARKSIHLASAALPLLYWGTNLYVMLCAVVPLLLLSLIMEWLRHTRGPSQGWLQGFAGHLFRPTERFTLSGSTYVMLANLVVPLLFLKEHAVAALLMMSISDAVASLVGRRVQGALLGGKSLAGSAAFFGTALLIVALIVPGRPLTGLVGALVATVVEAVPLRWGGLRIDDNLTIPLAAATAMTLLG